MSRLPRTRSDKAVAGMKVSSGETATKPLWRRRDSDRVHAEGRPTDRPLSRLLRRRPIPAAGAPRREAVGRGVADHAGGRERREGPRPPASGGGRQGVPVDALAEGRPRPRPGRLLQDVDRPEGRETHQGSSLARDRLERITDGLAGAVNPRPGAFPSTPSRPNGSPPPSPARSLRRWDS